MDTKTFSVYMCDDCGYGYFPNDRPTECDRCHSKNLSLHARTINVYNKPKCPTCQSTNLKKITTVSKAGSVMLFGIFAAGRTSKTWHCNNCGVEW